MADWTSRVALGTALCVLAPVSAHFALSGAASGDRNTATSGAYNAGTGILNSRYNRAGGNAPAAAQEDDTTDLLDPAQARILSGQETRTEFRRALCQFLVLYGSSQPVVQTAAPSLDQGPARTLKAPPAGDREEPSPEICTDPQQGKVEAMVAILPDPVRTHLSLRFDRTVDDLENGAQQLGWIFDKAWLPWRNDQGTSPDRMQERYVDEQMEQKREDQPGLLLFRREVSKEPLVMLVVGDTPTGGVNGDQFRNAIEVWRTLHTDYSPVEDCPESSTATKAVASGTSPAATSKKEGDAPALGTASTSRFPCRTLMILGPTFSGSALSLKSLLAEMAKGNADERLVVKSASGTMASSHLLRDLNSWNGTAPNPSVTSVSFAADMTYTQAHLLEFLDAHLPRQNANIAQLTEEESQFGAKTNLAEDLGDEVNNLKKLPQTAEWNKEIGRDQNFLSFLHGLRNGDRRRYLQFTFPREISVLREAYEQNGIMGFGAAADSNAPKTQLRLSYSENSSNGDAVQSFSGAQGASAMESRMAQIAATLEREKIAVAILSATDVLDEIFVARFLHEHAPSVTIVIQDADILFLRGGSDVSLDGTYVVSPYPLIPKNGEWSADLDSPLEPSPVLAQSQGDEGTVNAARYLLCGQQDPNASLAGEGCEWKRRRNMDEHGYLWMSEYEPPIPVDRNTDNDYKLQPPLWLSVIAHGSFQPVALIDLDQRNSELPESSELNLPRLGTVLHDPHTNTEMQVWDTHPAGIHDKPPVEMYACLAALLVLLGLHAWACLRCRLDRSFAWSYAAADEKPWLTRLLIQMGLTLVGIYALSLMLIHNFPGFGMEPLALKIFIIFIQGLLVLLNGMVALRSAAGRTLKSHWRITIASPIASALFTIAVDCAWWRLCGPAASLAGERTFFWYRSANLLSGASPTVPLLWLAAALAFWLRGRLAKLVFYGYRIPKLPSVGKEFRCPSQDSVRELNRLLGNPLWERRTDNQSRVNWMKLKVALASFALVGALLVVTWQTGPHSLASSGFDRLVDALAFMVAVGTVHNLLVSLVAWRMLRGECLVPLKQSPIRWGFNWIRGFSWKRLWTSPEGFTPEAELEYVMRNVEADSRGLMARCAPSPLLKVYKELSECYRSHDREKMSGADAANVEHGSRAEAALNEAAPPANKHLKGRKIWSKIGKWIKESAPRAKHSAQWADRLASTSNRLYKALAEESDDRLRRLRLRWRGDFGPLTGPEADRGVHNGRKPTKLEEPQRTFELQRMADEEFVAMVYLTYIRSVLVQIRNRVGTSAVLYILLLGALTGYPWMNRHAILLQMTVLLALLAAVAITIYAQLQKDDILSRTTETAPGKLDGQFFIKILSVVGIPALTLLASQFPEFSNAIFSWVVPGLSSVK